MRLVILVFVGLALGLPAAAADEESGPYPIWWSPSLELDSLDQIEARLQRSLWPDHPDSGFTVTVAVDNGEREDFARSCADMLRIEREIEHEYELWLSPWDQYSWRYHAARCRALEHLKQAAPARESFVRDFVLNPVALDVLPAMIDQGFQCEEKCRLYEANKERVSWRQYWAGWRTELLRKQGRFLGYGDVEDYFVEIDVPADHHVGIVSVKGWLVIEIMVRADLTGDGLEDLLVVIDNKPRGPRRLASRLYVFTREAAGEVLRVIDAELHVCPSYQCN